MTRTLTRRIRAPHADTIGRIARIVVLVIAAFATLGLTVEAITTMTGRTLFAFGGADPRLPLTYLRVVNQAELSDGATGTLAEADLLWRLLNGLPLLAQAATIALAAWLLRGVLLEAARRRPFGRAALVGWRRLTVTLVAGSLGAGGVSTIGFAYLYVNVLGPTFPRPEQRASFLGGDYAGLSFDFPDWPIPLIVAGLIAAALTSAFRAGARLERDVDGVI